MPVIVQGGRMVWDGPVKLGKGAYFILRLHHFVLVDHANGLADIHS